METIKMGKRGTVVIPAKMRKMFGLNDGSLLITEIKDGGINIRPAVIYEQEPWTDREAAYFMLINCMSKEEWDRMIPDVVAMGIDLDKIEGIEPSHRDTLRSDSEWNELNRQAKLASPGERLRV